MKVKVVFVLVVVLASLMVACIPSGRDYGKELYESNCANCHGIEGDGLQQLYPPLKNSDYLVEHQDKLACLIRFGIKDTIVVNGVEYQEPMPAQAMLSDIDVHNIINYISKNINPKLKPVQQKDVEEQFMNCNQY